MGTMIYSIIAIHFRSVHAVRSFQWHCSAMHRMAIPIERVKTTPMERGRSMVFLQKSIISDVIISVYCMSFVLSVIKWKTVGYGFQTQTINELPDWSCIGWSVLRRWGRNCKSEGTVNHMDGLVQGRRNSITLAMELRLFLHLATDNILSTKIKGEQGCGQFTNCSVS